MQRRAEGVAGSAQNTILAKMAGNASCVLIIHAAMKQLGQRQAVYQGKR